MLNKKKSLLLLHPLLTKAVCLFSYLGMYQLPPGLILSSLPAGTVGTWIHIYTEVGSQGDGHSFTSATVLQLFITFQWKPQVNTQIVLFYFAFY